MSRRVIGRVRPKYTGEYNAAQPYGVLDRAAVDGIVYECAVDAAAGEGPKQAPEKWITYTASVEEVSDVRATANAALSKAVEIEGALPDKADKTATEEAIAAKADAATTDAAIAKKADKAAVDAELAKKADQEATGTALATKADKAATEAALALKADKTALETGLAGKVSKAGDVMTGQLTIEVGGPAGSISDLQHYQDIMFVGSDGLKLGHVRGIVQGKAVAQKGIVIGVTNSTATNSSNLGILWDFKENRSVFFSVSPPASNYSSEIATTQWVRNFAPEKLTSFKTIYVGGANASDTADLFMGRGDTADKPFATLEAAINFAIQNYAGDKAVTISIGSDLIANINYLHVACLPYVVIESRDAANPCTVTLSNPVRIIGGSWYIRNVKFKMSDSSKNVFNIDGLYCGGSVLVFGEGVTIDGAASDVVHLFNNAVLRVEGSMAGNVTGRRYYAGQGSRILTSGKGPEAIPGTIAGTCDASSVYA